LRHAWLEAGDIEAQRRIAGELQMQAWKDVPFIPMGEYWQTTAYRKDITGPLPGCFTVFYNVRRTWAADRPAPYCPPTRAARQARFGRAALRVWYPFRSPRCVSEGNGGRRS
jgi:hypothetical protein